MLTFYAWVVFLVAVIAAVPIVHFLENRQRKANLPPPEASPEEGLIPEEGFGDEAAPLDEDGEPMELGGGDEIPADFNEFGGGTPVGEDDFSAFEEEFK